jgi:tetratricopeptide (TPR) repeat protein
MSSYITKHRVELVCYGILALLGFVATYSWRSLHAPPEEPLFSGLGDYRRSISTHSPSAQLYFDQGLAFLYAFNRAEAARSFQAAAAIDHRCAMAFWGIAMAHGPNVNTTVVDITDEQSGWQAAMEAQDRASEATDVEKALIGAVCKRFAPVQPSNRKTLNEAYAAAMRNVRRAYPEDIDVAALAAEGLLDMHPWKQWALDGSPQADTLEIVEILDAAIAKSPEHPFVLHLFVHAMEASPHPEKADLASDQLRTLAPGLSHLLHMPSHIDVRRGRWQQAITANERAIEAELFYRTFAPRLDFYGFGLTHNLWSLTYAAMMQGERDKATKATRGLLLEIKNALSTEEPAKIDPWFAAPFEVHLRFGDWDGMLAEPLPDAAFPISRALWHYARGVAFAAKKEVAKAKEEQGQFSDARRRVADRATFLMNRARDILDVAEKVLVGEILFREGRAEAAARVLRDAVRREDLLSYEEPPVWVLPARHALGAVLLAIKNYSEAEAVYREDLSRHPENGWALYGLSESLRLQGKQAEAGDVAARFKKVWEHSDIHLSASCLCLQRKS